jgi:hypothetical protein
MKSIPVLVLFLLAVISSEAFAGVAFYDDIAVMGKPLMLKAETRGRFFRKGGEIVEFYVNDASIGRTLSGGDGVAFKEFVPEKTGLYEITVTSGKDKTTGFVLSLRKGEGVVFVDVIGGLFEDVLSKTPRKDGKDAIRKIMKNNTVVYLWTEMFGMAFAKKWLKENEFPAAPLIRWKGGRVFDEINEKGLKIKAVIGSPAVIVSAREYKPESFSFEDVEDAQQVKDWKEIVDSF